MEEIWKPVPGFEGSYEISSISRVRSLHTRHGEKGKILRQQFKGEYYQVALMKDGHRRETNVSRLMAEAFLPVPDDLKQFIGTRYLQVNHKDENKRNNVIDNLEWCTAKYNMNYGGRRDREMASKKINGASNAECCVYGYSLDDLSEHYFKSISEAERECGVRHVWANITGQRTRCGKYIFVRESERLTREELIKRVTEIDTTVCQFTEEGVIVARYKSASDASRVTGMARGGISSSLNGHNSTGFGYYWVYESDLDKMRDMDLLRFLCSKKKKGEEYVVMDDGDTAKFFKILGKTAQGICKIASEPILYKPKQVQDSSPKLF